MNRSSNRSTAAPLPCAAALAAAALLLAPVLAPAQNFLRRVVPGAELEASEQAPVRFIGASAFSEEQLRSAIATQLGEIVENGLTAARADDAAFFLASFYRKNGYARAEVDYETPGGVLILRIREGPQVLIRDVDFIGNRSIQDDKLYEYLIGGQEERLAREPSQFPYTEAQLSAGADRVRGLYNFEGFLDAEVDTAQTRITGGGKEANVVVRIREGKRYTFGEIRFAGETIFPREELIAALNEPVEGPYSPSRVNSMERHLQSFYKGRGYFLTEVIGESDHSTSRTGRVPVTFRVTPKGQFRFNGVTLRDETPEKPRLRRDFLPKRFRHLRGQVYSPEKLDETFREMLRTGLFSNFRVATTPIEDNQLRLDITYEEAKARELGFNIGAGSYEGLIAGFSVADRNFMGNGRPLSLTVQTSLRGLGGELLYVDPWLFETRYALRARLYSVSREEIGYARVAHGVRFDVTRSIARNFELGLFFEGANVSVESLGIPPPELGPPSYLITTVGITQSLDYRDSPINPTRGFIATSAFDVNLLDQEPAFTRVTLRLSYYLPIGKTLLMFGARGGLITPIADAIPIDVRYFSGGGTTVRSFEERRLGPKAKSGHPIGGELFSVFNIEYMFPLVGGLQGAVFADAGSLHHDTALESSTSGGDMRFALGVGLRYRLPIGPLRLDYGINPDPRNEEKFGAFHFSFGFAF